MAISLLPGLGALRAAKGAGAVIKGTKLAKHTKVISALEKTADSLTKGSKVKGAAAKSFDEIAGTLTNSAKKNIDNAVKKLEGIKGNLQGSGKALAQKQRKVDGAIELLEETKNTLNPKWTGQIFNFLDNPVMKASGEIARASLVVDGIFRGLPSVVKVFDATLDDDVSAAHVLTEEDIRNTYRAMGAFKGLTQYANKALIWQGTSYKGAPAETVTGEGMVGKIKAFGKNSKSKFNYTKGKLSGENRVLKDADINDGWFNQLAK